MSDLDYGEVAPGVYVRPFVPPGAFYRMDLEAFGLAHDL